MCSAGDLEGDRYTLSNEDIPEKNAPWIDNILNIYTKERLCVHHSCSHTSELNCICLAPVLAELDYLVMLPILRSTLMAGSVH